MITNERQYKITRAEAAKIKAGIDEFDEVASLKSGLDPLIVKAQRDSLESLHDDLLSQINEYERLRSGSVKEHVGDLFIAAGNALIRARISRGLSQSGLAEKLGMKQQQIQRYEADGYQSATLPRLGEVADALGLEVSFTLRGTPPSTDGLMAPSRKSVHIDFSKLPVREMKQRRWFDDIVSQTGALPDEALAAAFVSQAMGSASSPALLRQNVRAGGKLNMHALLAWQARVLQLARKTTRQSSIPAAVEQDFGVDFRSENAYDTARWASASDSVSAIKGGSCLDCSASRAHSPRWCCNVARPNNTGCGAHIET